MMTPVLKFNNGSGGNFGSDAAYQIAENQTIAGFLYVKEFDATDDVNITLDSTQLDNQAFGQPVRDLSYSPPDPDFPNEKKYNLSFLAAKDYESNSVLSRNFQYKLKVWARDGNGGDVNQTLTITITPVDEAPGISPTGQVDFAITEDKSGNVDGSFYRQKGYYNISVNKKDRNDNSVILNLSNFAHKGKSLLRNLRSRLNSTGQPAYRCSSFAHNRSDLGRLSSLMGIRLVVKILLSVLQTKMM